MADTNIQTDLLELMQQLPLPQQRQVLDYARGLRKDRPQGISGKKALELAGILPDRDAAEMTRIIEEGCERIDEESWR